MTKHNNSLNLKATELRLGLPGSESPDRDKTTFNTTINNSSNNVAGAKRGFAVALNPNNKNWVSAETDHHCSFSPRISCGGGKMVPGSNFNDGLPPSRSPKLAVEEKKQTQVSAVAASGVGGPATKAQVVGWPPIRSFRKNTMASQTSKNEDDVQAKFGSGGLFVKVSMDGAPYLRKVDLKNYGSYMELSSALGMMFSCFSIGQCGSNGNSSQDGLSESGLIDILCSSEFVLTYEDKDGDWMLVGDVPWKMFTDTCRRLRIMKSSEAIGLAPRGMDKSVRRD